VVVTAKTGLISRRLDANSEEHISSNLPITQIPNQGHDSHPIHAELL